MEPIANSVNTPFDGLLLVSLCYMWVVDSQRLGWLSIPSVASVDCNEVKYAVVASAMESES